MNEYLKQCLLFNGRVLVSIRNRTSGSHLRPSPPCNQKSWNWAFHRTKSGHNISLEWFQRSSLTGKRMMWWSLTGQITLSTQQRSPTPHLPFTHSCRDTFKLWPVLKCWRVIQYCSNQHGPAFTIYNISDGVQWSSYYSSLPNSQSAHHTGEPMP